MKGRVKRERLVVAVVSAESGVGRAVLRGIAVAVGKFGWSLEVIDPAVTGDDFRPYADLLGRADGVVVRLAGNCRNVQPFIRGDAPIVGIDILSDVDAGMWATLLPDNAGIGEAAAEELLPKGLKCYAVVPLLPRTSWGEERDRGFSERIRATGGDVRVYEPHEAWRAAGERDALARWLAALPRPFGLFASNDILAKFALGACKEAGISVPDEAMIIGADNDETLCLYCSPQLTSVRIDHEGAGRRAAEALQGYFGKQRPKRIATMRFGPCGVARRASTNEAAPGFDLRLVAGLDFIASHSENPFIGAGDVAAAMGLGRRQAERLFHAAGTSIRRKLEETRLAHVKSLLATTRLPLRRIAAECGFYSDIYLSGVFRKRLGMSPGAWRKGQSQRQ